MKPICALAMEHFQAAARAGHARAQEILAFMSMHESEMDPGVAPDMRRDTPSVRPSEPHCIYRLAQAGKRRLQ